MINVLIVGKYEDAIRRVGTLTAQLADELDILGTAQNEKTALEQIDALNPDVVIVALAGGDKDLILLAKRIYVYKPRVVTLVFSETLDSAQYEECISCGVRYAGGYPQNAREFLAELGRIIEAETARIGYLGTRKNTVLDSSTVIGVYSPKAGVGNTTVVANLAITLASEEKNVAVLDLDLEFGDVCAYMDITPKKSIADLVSDYGAPSINDIETYMEIAPSGVHVLAAPKSPEYAETVSVDRIIGILDTLKVYYDYILIDLPGGMNVFHTKLFGRMNRIYLVTSLQLNVLRSAKLAANIINILGMKGKACVIVNRYSKYDIISLRDVHKILDCRIIAAISSDYRPMSNAVNRGVPVVVSYPHNAIAKIFRNIAAYTVAKVDDFDIWDMSPKEVSREYAKFNKMTLSAKKDGRRK